MDIPHYNEDVTVRLATPEDREQLTRIGTRAFNCNALDWYDNPCLVVEPEKGYLAAVVGCRPCAAWWGTRHVPGTAVGGVATHPKEQKKGYAGAAIVAAIHWAREQGYAVCPLWPFSHAYYRKFGWDSAMLDRSIQAWPAALRRLPETSGDVRSARQEDIPALAEVYSRCAHETNGQSVRSDEWWTDRFKPDADKKLQVHLDAQGAIDGYLFYQATPRALAEGCRVQVHEIQALSPGGLAALARSCADIPGAMEVAILVPPDSLLPELFPDHTRIEAQRRLELRVLDVPQALEALAAPEWLQGTFGLRVRDWVVRREGTLDYRVTVDGGCVEVVEGAVDGPIACTINTFSRLYMGALNMTQVRQLGLLEGGDADSDALCDLLLYGRVPFRSMLEDG